jgi:hypothetical protein
VKADLATAQEKLAAEAQRAETAKPKHDANRASLENAKDALAAALLQIEEAESRGID